MSVAGKPRIPFYWWPLWMLILAGAIVVFYGFFTPAWMAIRLVAWLSEHGRPGKLLGARRSGAPSE